MDYKYIEQLLDRYFDCQTTLQEEQILRSFFAQEDVPASMMQYADLFRYESDEQSMTLGDDFDARMMALIAEKEGKQTHAGGVIKMPRRNRFAPFFRAAAAVAIILTVGGAAEHAISDQQQAPGYNNATAINPYIKQADIPNAIHVKDISHAESNQKQDSSLIVVPVADGVQ